MPIFGPYTGELLNTGERLKLSRPADRASFVPLSMADQVVYNATPGWPEVADGRGASLNRISFVEYGNDIVNWSAGIPTPGRSNSDLQWDFFPEAGDMKLFKRDHADLMTPEWWKGMKETLESDMPADIFPYPERKRFGNRYRRD